MDILATTRATGAKKLYHASAILSITINASGKMTSFSYVDDTGAAATIDAAAAVATTLYQAGEMSQQGKLAGIIWSNL
jgi:hydroxymethylglutaryl-CoA reductase